MGMGIVSAPYAVRDVRNSSVLERLGDGVLWSGLFDEALRLGRTVGLSRTRSDRYWWRAVGGETQ
jgi:hypothetical protein